MAQVMVEITEANTSQATNLGHHGRGDRKAQKRRYEAKHPEKILQQRRRYREKYGERDNAKRRERHNERKANDPSWVSKEKAYYLARYERRKYLAMATISGFPPHCERCGCDDLRFLEFNHKIPNYQDPNKPKGLKARHDRSKNTAYRLVSGRMSPKEFDNLEITCRVCNAHDYLEKKYGDTRHKVLWT